MLGMFNLVYSLISTPARAVSDRVPHKALLVGGWLFYVLVYFGLGLARENRPVLEAKRLGSSKLSY